jgi:hypothetical protein
MKTVYYQIEIKVLKFIAMNGVVSVFSASRFLFILNELNVLCFEMIISFWFPLEKCWWLIELGFSEPELKNQGFWLKFPGVLIFIVNSSFEKLDRSRFVDGLYFTEQCKNFITVWFERWWKNDNFLLFPLRKPILRLLRMDLILRSLLNLCVAFFDATSFITN